MRAFSRVGFLFGLVSFAALGRADIAYNNFDVGDGFNSASNWSCDINQQLAMPFTSLTSGTVSQVTVALFANANYVAHLELADNGLNPGTVLESWSFTGTGAAQSFAGAGTTNLTAGTNYWLEIDPATSSDFGAWYLNSTGASGTFLFTSGGTWLNTNSPLSVFRVETNPVPEPFSIAGLAIGCAALVRRRRK